jgi:hypothetical protein
MSDDLDATREFTHAETLRYNPRACPKCGRRTAYYQFVETSGLGSATRSFLRGRGRCENRQCAFNGGPEGADV